MVIEEFLLRIDCGVGSARLLHKEGLVLLVSQPLMWLVNSHPDIVMFMFCKLHHAAMEMFCLRFIASIDNLKRQPD